MLHEIIPIPNKEYIVNGKRMVVLAVANAPKYNNMVISSNHGRFVYVSRRFKSGRVAKGVIRYWNGMNNPSWYKQDITCI